MPVATSHSPRSSSAIRMEKMEERKRPASTTNTDEVAPPRKRHATNGGNSHEDYEKYENQSEEAWITHFAKGAIYRRMNEYRREAHTISNRLEELHKRSLYHDDHLRIVDAWWRQFFDELEVIVGSKVPDLEFPSSDSLYLSCVNFQDVSDFQRHLDEKKRTLSAKAESLLSRLAANRGNIKPDVPTLESEIAKMLAQQKEFLVKLDRLSTEKDQLSEQLNTATLRYFKAEKKLDRAKSAQVAKLEQQALSRDTRSTGGGATSNGNDNGNGNGNGENSEPSANTVELMTKLEEESASVRKQKEQIDQLLAELKTLQEDNTKLHITKDASPDEEYSRTDLFKTFRTKTDELIKQVNHLEATNASIREECSKLLAERTAFKRQLEADSKAVAAELDTELLARDTDLARIRTSRDETLQELNIKKQILDQEHTAATHLKELVAAKDDKIASLEARIARLEPPAEDTEMADAGKNVDGFPESELRQRYKKLQRDYESINHELPAITQAYKKAMMLSHSKVMNLEALEKKLDFMTADKGRVDTKYFSARKDADHQKTELHMLRREANKSGEIIAQLKEVEANNRSTMAILEKQLAHLKQSNASLAAEHKKLETASGDATRKSEAAIKEVQSLKELLSAKDTTLAELREKALTKENEAERFRAKAESVSKDRDIWRKKAEGNSSDVEQNLRTLMLCTICNDRFKDTALKVCGHLFCKECINDRISNRMRKCPNCSKAFDKMDVMAVHH